MTQKELDAVMAYLDKLRPQCETKVMSYAEKKALQILDAPALVQIRHLRGKKPFMPTMPPHLIPQHDLDMFKAPKEAEGALGSQPELSDKVFHHALDATIPARRLM